MNEWRSGIDYALFVVHPAFRSATGARSIPVLIAGTEIIDGEQAIHGNRGRAGGPAPLQRGVYTQHGHTHIAAVNAEQMLAIVGNDALAETASEVRRRLAAVVERAAPA